MASRRLSRSKRFASYLAALNNDVSRVQARPNITGIASGIVGGSNLSTNIILDNNFLQSSNYIPNLYGWKIDSDGNAEFGNVYVRGNINAETGTIGYWNISAPTVERVIGDRLLFGTFIESGDLGATDEGKNSGTYVGLFKSYSEDGVAITNKWRVSNVATVRAPGHGFENGDYVNINVESDITYSTGEANARIFDVSADTFSYVNFGPDEEIYNANLSVEVDTTAYGLATLYVKDVAGLYLQDYGRSQFDYGYFSNEGLAYVSAETPNLVYNPSAEYVVSGDIIASPENINPQNANWSLISNFGEVVGTVSTHEFTANTSFDSASVYGIKYQWSDSLELGYVSVKTNISEMVSRKYVENDRTLFLNFDFFYEKASYPSSTVSAAVLDMTTIGVGQITITTATDHGLSIGDVIVLDGTFSSTSPSINYGGALAEMFGTVLDVLSNTQFVIRYKQYYSGSDGVVLTPSSGCNVYKYIQPVLDLQNIKIGVFNGTNYDVSTSLYDVLTDVSLATWSSDRYWSISRVEHIESVEYLIKRSVSPFSVVDVKNTDLTRVERIPVEIQISSAKLYEKYKIIAGADYVDYQDFYLCFPNHVLVGTEELSKTWDTEATISVPVLVGGQQVPALASETMSIIIDNVSLSPINKFFYGDSGSSSFSYNGYDPTDELSYKYNFTSLESPREWLSIDLDSQTAQLKYWDSVEFKSNDFKKQTYLNPSIDTINRETTQLNSTVYSYIHVGDASVLNFTSGSYRYYYDYDSTWGDIYRQVESIASSKTGEKSAVFEISTSGKFYDSNDSVVFDGGYPAVFKIAVDDTAPSELYPSTGWANSSINLNASTIDSYALGKDGSISYIQMRTAPSLIDIGTNALYLSASSIYATNIYSTTVTGGPRTLYINSAGRLGGISSSRSTKENVRPIEYSLDTLLQVEPVMFTYVGQEDDYQYAGFIAEELDSLGLSSYVSYDSDGKPVTVNYEFYVSALQKIVRELSNQIGSLNTRLSALEGNV